LRPRGGLLWDRPEVVNHAEEPRAKSGGEVPVYDRGAASSGASPRRCGAKSGGEAAVTKIAIVCRARVKVWIGVAAIFVRSP